MENATALNNESISTQEKLENIKKTQFLLSERSTFLIRLKYRHDAIARVIEVPQTSNKPILGIRIQYPLGNHDNDSSLIYNSVNSVALQMHKDIKNPRASTNGYREFEYTTYKDEIISLETLLSENH